MNIQPPIAMRFHEINGDQIRNARAGVCPHCPQSSPFQKSLAAHHTSGNLEFFQCTRCLVMVALEKV